MQLSHPSVLLVLIPAAVLVGWLESRIAGTRVRRLLRGGARLAVVAAALVAWAEPTAPVEIARVQRLVVALDRSADMDPRARREAETAARAAVRAAGRDGIAASAVAFAGLPGPAQIQDPRAPWHAPRDPGDAGTARRARLEAGLAAAALAFGEDERGRIVVLTTGRGDHGGVPQALLRLHARGIEVRAMAVPSTATAPALGARILAVRSPTVVRGAFDVHVALDPHGEDVRVRLFVDGTGQAAQAVRSGGPADVHFEVPELAPGEHELGIALERVGAAGGEGTQTGTRTALARRLVTVAPPPRALGILLDAERSDLRRALSAQGFQVAAIPPTAAAEALRSGGRVDLVFLDAASAVRLDAEAQRILRQRVLDGLGLLFEAGPDPAAWAALRDMPLADLLPLRPAEPPPAAPEPPKPPPPSPRPPPPIDPPEDRPEPGIEAVRQPAKALPITVLLLVDRSASMTGDKLALALEGARRAAGALSPWDRVGIITFADEPTLDIPPRPADRMADLNLWLSTVQAGGGTDIFRALRLASQVLARETSPIQHLILLTDGKTGGVTLWHHVVGPMGRRGVTLTAVGIGEQQSRRELREIIQWAARASLISVYTPKQLPTVLTKDTRGLAERRRVEAERLDRLQNPDPEPATPEPERPEEPTPPAPPPQEPEPNQPEPTAPEPEADVAFVPLQLIRRHEALQGFTQDRLPAVGPPRAAEAAFGTVVLIARGDAPVLAARRQGLGRVLQWVLPPSDAGARTWKQLGRLYGQAARAVMAPEGAFRFTPRLTVRSTPQADRVRIEWPAGDATRLTLRWRDEDGHTQDLGTFSPTDPDPVRTLPRTGPGRLCRLEATLEDGRTMPPVSYLTAPVGPSISPAGDRAALARLFGEPGVDATALGQSVPGGTRTRRRPLFALFLWIAVGLLPLDVLLHRRTPGP